jgi:hypothetical protein
VTTRIDPLDTQALLETTRQAIAASTEGIDVSAVRSDTPLAAVLFDSLMALRFIATLEAELGLSDLPFEQWLAEHSERADALTIGSLVEWLVQLPQVRLAGAAEGRGGAGLSAERG